MKGGQRGGMGNEACEVTDSLNAALIDIDFISSSHCRRLQ